MCFISTLRSGGEGRVRDTRYVHDPIRAPGTRSPPYPKEFLENLQSSTGHRHWSLPGLVANVPELNFLPQKHLLLFSRATWFGIPLRDFAEMAK